MDKLKKYFRENEASMNMDSPDENRLWERIGAGSPGKTSRRNQSVFIMRFAAAACIIILAGAGWMLFMKNNKKQAEEPVIVKSNPAVVTDTPRNTPPPVIITTTVPKQNRDLPGIQATDEADKIGQSYAHIINLQLSRLRATAIYAESPGYFAGFKQQLTQMDKDEAMIRKDIKGYGLTDPLLEQLINVYQQKLNLLKTLQTAINKMNNKVKEKQHAPGKAHVYHINI